ncbi:hypothetical protein [Zunongwangia atlantica]|uniref:Uncharacterized protein n=1 Tax=Zunongwangia atlantica 22II14-10F7 TaxID=1185767 RepID=A0A1Y1SYX6_9FLAO|nr:hypothetical protein [Zunongwangia atlantica]ORL43957.1 hypothetical protein IIF7_18362 [Zunongwangia atlantica 22II14-10F7]
MNKELHIPFGIFPIMSEKTGIKPSFTSADFLTVVYLCNYRFLKSFGLFLVDDRSRDKNPLFVVLFHTGERI